jgi:phosphoglycolate phosphatase-like HAD superfamily hydrolase
VTSPEQKDLIVFDFNGVFDTGDNQVFNHVIWRCLDESGVDVTRQMIAQRMNDMSGKAPKKVMLSFVNDNPEARKSALELHDRYMASDFVEMTKTIPGSAETIEALKSKYSLALNTSADRRNLFRVMLPRLGIDASYFEGGIITEDDLPEEEQKPEPAGLFRLLKANNVQPERAIMVGDSITDILSAGFAGVEPVATLSGNLTLLQALELPVDYIIKDVTELPEVAQVHFRRIGRAGLQLADGAH